MQWNRKKRQTFADAQLRVPGAPAAAAVAEVRYVGDMADAGAVGRGDLFEDDSTDEENELLSVASDPESA